MRLLLDENVPRQLKKDLEIQHSVVTVREKRWNGLEDSHLLQLMTEEKFDAFITCDKNLQYQQNFLKNPTPVIIFDAYTNAYPILKTFIPALLDLLQRPLNPGVTVLAP